MAALESANRRLPESPRDGGRAVDLAMASRAAIARVASTAGQRAFGTGSVCPVPTASRIAKLLIQVQRQRRRPRNRRRRRRRPRNRRRRRRRPRNRRRRRRRPRCRRPRHRQAPPLPPRPHPSPRKTAAVRSCGSSATGAAFPPSRVRPERAAPTRTSGTANACRGRKGRASIRRQRWNAAMALTSPANGKHAAGAVIRRVSASRARAAITNRAGTRNACPKARAVPHQSGAAGAAAGAAGFL